MKIKNYLWKTYVTSKNRIILNFMTSCPLHLMKYSKIKRCFDIIVTSISYHARNFHQSMVYVRPNNPTSIFCEPLQTKCGNKFKIWYNFFLRSKVEWKASQLFHYLLNGVVIFQEQKLERTSITNIHQTLDKNIDTKSPSYIEVWSERKIGM